MPQGVLNPTLTRRVYTCVQKQGRIGFVFGADSVYRSCACLLLFPLCPRRKGSFLIDYSCTNGTYLFNFETGTVPQGETVRVFLFLFFCVWCPPPTCRPLLLLFLASWFLLVLFSHQTGGGLKTTRRAFDIVPVADWRRLPGSGGHLVGICIGRCSGFERRKGAEG